MRKKYFFNCWAFLLWINNLLLKKIKTVKKIIYCFYFNKKSILVNKNNLFCKFFKNKFFKLILLDEFL